MSPICLLEAIANRKTILAGNKRNRLPEGQRGLTNYRHEESIQISIAFQVLREVHK